MTTPQPRLIQYSAIFICSLLSTTPFLSGQTAAQLAEVSKKMETLKTFQERKNGNQIIATAEEIVQYYETNGLPVDDDLLEVRNLLSTRYFVQGEFRKSIDQDLAILRFQEANFPDNDERLAISYLNLCESCNQWRRTERARTYCRKAQQIMEAAQATDSEDYIYIFMELGTSAIYEGDYESAVTLYQKSLDLFLKIIGPDDAALTDFYYNISNAYLGQRAHKEALEYLRKAYRIDSLTNNPFGMADILDNMGAVYMDQGDYKRSEGFLKKAIQYYRKAGQSNHPHVAHAFNITGNCYLEMGKPTEARRAFNNALSVLEESAEDQPVKVSEACRGLAEGYQASNNFELAHSFLDRSEKLIVMDDGAELLADRAVDLSEYQKLIGAKANLAFRESRVLQSLDKLKLAAAYYDQSIQLINTIRAGYDGKNAKSQILSFNRKLFERALEANVVLLQQTRDTRYEEAIFKLMEQGKSMLLLESLRGDGAKRYAGIPEELIQAEKSLELDLSDVESDIQALRSGTPSITAGSLTEKQLAKLHSNLFTLRTKHRQIIDQMENEYPRYFAAKYDTTVILSNTIKETLLPPTGTLIEYFVGDEFTLIFKLMAKEIKVYKSEVSKAELEKQVRQMRNGIYGQQTAQAGSSLNNADTYQSSLQQYQEAAYFLFQKLISPLVADGLPKQLIIIPDGILGYVPFDALLQELPASGAPFRDFDFLIREHQISYNYSAVLWQEMREQPIQGRGKVLGVAPSFEVRTTDLALEGHTRGNLGPLDFNQPEVKSIKRMVGGKALIDQQATKAAFLSLAPDYRILHLSTHGLANNRIGKASFLAFTEIPDSIDENERLYVRELYNLDLNAEMVVLSACETGIGELQGGEGVISLARGFSYAGAKSIIMTLWKVDDAKSKELMVHYYRYLKEGLTKSAALQQSKLDIIANSRNDLAHPFYWASFVPMGDMSPVSLKPGISWWVILLVGIILLFSIYFFTKKPDILKTKYTS